MRGRIPDTHSMYFLCDSRRTEAQQIVRRTCLGRPCLRSYRWGAGFVLRI